MNSKGFTFTWNFQDLPGDKIASIVLRAEPVTNGQPIAPVVLGGSATQGVIGASLLQPYTEYNTFVDLTRGTKQTFNTGKSRTWPTGKQPHYDWE